MKRRDKKHNEKKDRCFAGKPYTFLSNSCISRHNRGSSALPYDFAVMYQPKLPKDLRCPLEHALEFINGRWKSRILCLLYSSQSQRYGELKKLLDNITDTVLTATLKELIADGIVQREQFAEIPPRVEYSLTDKGRELVPFLRQICKWASQYHRPGENDDSELAHCKACVVRAAGLKK